MGMTIRDIAEMCDVSTATVSRVLNSPDQVAEKTREKVLQVIKEENYIPNQIAKNLNSNITNNIALFIFDIMNPFFTKLIKEANRIAFDWNYSLIICDTENEKERELKYLNYINKSKFAGLILTEGISGEILEKLDPSYPVVCIDRYINSNSNRNYPIITSENREGARKAVEYLVTLNHKKIAHVSGTPGVKTADERKQGYLDIVEKYELPVDERYIYTGDFRTESGIKALEYFLSLEEMPTAIFCANDLMAKGLLGRSMSLNINVPGDLSIIGFDGILNNSYYKLTTVKQSIAQMAAVAMKELINLIEKKTVSPKERKIPGKLIVGDTCQKL
ncbi:LacI family DNA-binding transcriptional regulator [Halocella sp. SP3-1]|uniref:LacI family DNA-binding transcriptional regulator n=1 Tax=Halocella sp. SP3-1 TaxID=2382161 RepID=UPI000F75C7E7|nr:LacI family DNA-binding transcriptional regulator [Halocella sp. SP3-1]AZO93688.1 LacI family transcriptional regulator [Halocella sp. SP3-1]